MPANRGFTLVEVLVAVVVVGILSAAGAVGYQSYRDRTAQMVDETHESVLTSAVKLYAYDEDAVPGSLSQLPSTLVRRAYVQYRQNRQPYTLLAHLQRLYREMTGAVSSALADDFLPAQYFNSDIEILVCPSDLTPPRALDASGRIVGTDISYALNPAIAGISLRDFKNLSPDTVIIFESDEVPLAGSDYGGYRVYRHGGLLGSDEISVATTLDKKVKKEKKAKKDKGDEEDKKDKDT